MAGGVFRLDLLGSFRLVAPSGVRVLVTSKRSRVLLAMLATSRSGERSRRWLQERLWGSRERSNSQASLRRELSNLRRLVSIADCELLIVERETVAIDLARVAIDVRDPARILESREDFLEGIDIACEEGFEDWLREERQSITASRESGQIVRESNVVSYGSPPAIVQDVERRQGAAPGKGAAAQAVARTRMAGPFEITPASRTRSAPYGA